MTFRRAVRIVLASVLVGLLIGIIFSGSDLVSVEIWISASAVAIAVASVTDLLVASDLEGLTLIPAWSRATPKETSSGPAGVRNLRSLVTSAQSNPRLYSRRLRPHLLGLAEHFLPRRHGLNIVTDRSRVSDLLKDVDWLLDPSVTDRAPTTDELDRFLNLVVGEERMPIS